MAEFNIINWNVFFEKSTIFKKNKPFKYAFIEEFFDRDFYEKLYKTFPKVDDSWHSTGDYSKAQLVKVWGKYKPAEAVSNTKDPTVSKEWNKFYQYLFTKEFADNIRKFSGIDVNRVKSFKYINYKKGGFQLPHIHNDGPTTLIIFLYFSKNWKQGDPGGTYIASEEDESKIIFEPYNLDNSMVIMHDGPKSAHGARRIIKDVERRAVQIYFENYSPQKGWSGDKKNKIELKEI